MKAREEALIRGGEEKEGARSYCVNQTEIETTPAVPETPFGVFVPSCKRRIYERSPAQSFAERPLPSRSLPPLFLWPLKSLVTAQQWLFERPGCRPNSRCSR